MRWSAAISVAAVLIACLPCRAACADDGSGTWESNQRDTLRANVGNTIDDLFSAPPKFYWDRGPVLETKHQTLAFHAGYETQEEYTSYIGPNPEVEAAAGARWTSGIHIRRNRVKLEAFFLEYWYARVRYGWEGAADFEFADAFVEWSGLTRFGKDWWPTFRVGQIKEPITLDWMNGALWTTFAERAMFTTSIVPNRTPGGRIHGTGLGERLTYQIGMFNSGAVVTTSAPDDGTAVTARVTGLPWAPKAHERRLLHVGLAGSYRWGLEKAQYAAKAESDRGPNIVDTGEYAAETVLTGAAELFFQCERFSFLSEGAVTHVEMPGGESATYWGWFGQVSYFIKGPGINFNRGFGVFGRIHPKCNIFSPKKERGWGAWEVAARLSILDLDSGPNKGGSVWTGTLGLNWWARDNVRMLLNYIHTSVEDAYGVPGANSSMHTFTVRAQWDL